VTQADDRRDRGHVHDAPAAAFDHWRDRMLAGQEGPARVDGEHVLPDLQRRVGRRGRRPDAGHVDQRVEVSGESASRTASSSVERRGGPRLAPSGREARVARLSWSVSRREWTLFWRDRDHRWHRYKYTAPTTEIARLLEEIDRDPTGIFWG